ncbi:MAG: hypothetical protein HY304_05925 [candidate division Zixibacteria bacterium]|nr:hypothetical protein [candidate division Zixibacteria bacterium]
MKRWILLAAVAVGLLDGKGIRADNSIVVESKWVAPGATDVEIGVFVSNAAPIIAIILPLEIRSAAPGVFITDSLRFQLVPGSRIDNSSLGSRGDPCAGYIHDYQFGSPAGVQCSGPVSGTYSGQSPSSVDFISPDAVLWVSVSNLDVDFCGLALEPGADPPGTANASLRFRFNVTSTPGIFEIDTCCVTPANHLSFFDVYLTPIRPEFTKGTIEIVDCDGVTDIADVIRMVNVAFGGSPNRHSFATPARVRRTTALHFTRRAGGCRTSSRGERGRRTGIHLELRQAPASRYKWATRSVGLTTMALTAYGFDDSSDVSGDVPRTD